MLPIQHPAPLTPAQCMSFYVADIICCTFKPGTLYDIRCSCVPAIVSCSNPCKMYIILCSRICVPPLQPRHNVCCSMFLIWFPAPLAPAQCMLLYVPDLVCCPFNPRAMYVIICPWYSIPPLPTLAQCMLFCVLDFVPRHFTASTMYAILCSWYSILPLQHLHNVCYSMSLIWCAARSTPA